MINHRDDLSDLLELIGGQDNPLLRIERAQWVIKTAEDDLRAAVREARAQGSSWAAVGAALGLTKQAAHLRYGSVGAGA